MRRVGFTVVTFIPPGIHSLQSYSVTPSLTSNLRDELKFGDGCSAGSLKLSVARSITNKSQDIQLPLNFRYMAISSVTISQVLHGTYVYFLKYSLFICNSKATGHPEYYLATLVRLSCDGSDCCQANRTLSWRLCLFSTMKISKVSLRNSSEMLPSTLAVA